MPSSSCHNTNPTSVLFPSPPPGTYLVTLTAIDSDGQTGFDEVILTITDPSGTFTGWMIE